MQINYSYYVLIFIYAECVSNLTSKFFNIDKFVQFTLIALLNIHALKSLISVFMS